MSHPIVYVDHSSIRAGKRDAVEREMNHLAGFVQTHMPRILSYGFFLNPQRTEMTVVAVHPDSASLEFHMDTGREEFRKFAQLIELTSIEVYGQVSASVLERLRQKADMLGHASVTVHALYAGFMR